MREAATITFQDTESSDDAVIIVRHDEHAVALCVSLKSDGDLEVFMKKEDARRLIAALERAVA